MATEKNEHRLPDEWYLDVTKGVLHIGTEINGSLCTVPSHRVSWPDASRRQLAILDMGSWCIIYSRTFPLLEIFESYIETVDIPEDLKDHTWFGVRQIAHYPYCVEDICFSGDSVTVFWKGGGSPLVLKSVSSAFLPSDLVDLEIKPVRTLDDLIKYADNDSDNDDHDDIGILVKRASPCGRFIAAFFERGDFVDVFDMECRGGRFMYQVRHNEYQRHIICNVVEFVGDEKKLRLLINTQHACLTVYEAETGNKLFSHYTNDEFYSNVFRVKGESGEHLVLYGFVWGPIFFMRVCDLNTLVELPKSYDEGIIRFSDEYDFDETYPGQEQIEKGEVCKLDGRYYKPLDFQKEMCAYRAQTQGSSR